MRYELYYWPSIQGRGEFVRLALEEAGADYVDVARQPETRGSGLPAMLDLLDGSRIPRPPFAPPILKAGKQIFGQTSNILLYLGDHLGLAPASEPGRLFANQLQLTIGDFVDEIHDTHHPIAVGNYYEEQRREAKRRAADFLENRAPKFIGYFERLLANNASGRGHLIGARLSYPDLSLFQVVAGLRYAFPQAMTRLERRHERVVGLHDKIARRPRIAAYLESERRLPFNEDGLFRLYKELDEKA